MRKPNVMNNRAEDWSRKQWRMSPPPSARAVVCIVNEEVTIPETLTPETMAARDHLLSVSTVTLTHSPPPWN
ncbi:unnamed protein product, partial [Arabidopsis lyrata]